MAKVHLFLSNHPLRSGESVAARCGDLVTKATILHSWDTTAVNAKMEWPLGICGKCIKAAEQKHEGRLLVYAITDRVYQKNERENR